MSEKTIQRYLGKGILALVAVYLITRIFDWPTSTAIEKKDEE